jgi:hypothetical protein
MYYGVLASIEASLLVLVIGYVPSWISNGINGFASPVTIRWVLICLGLLLFVSFASRKSTEKRGLYSALILLTVFFIGWLFDRWVGVLFITVPILLIFYHVIDKVAQVILPSATRKIRVSSDKTRIPHVSAGDTVSILGCK